MVAADAGVAPVAARRRGTSEWGLRWRRYRRNKLGVVGLAVCVVLVVAALFAPVIAPHGYATPDYPHAFEPPLSPGHLLGTDTIGRDVFSRLLISLRTALSIAFGAELTALVLALAVGLLAGYRGGRLDQVLMAGTDVMFAFPAYLFTVVLVTVMGRGKLAIIIAIAIASWVGQARLIRAQVLKIKQLEYVEAGRSMGARGPTIVLRYILPNALGPILVTTSFGIPAAMLTEAGLAVLGLGVQPPTPSLGTMILDGYSYILTSPSLVVAPLIVFVLAMLSFTWIGDAIRDAFDTGEV